MTTAAVTDFNQYDRMRLDANAEDSAVLREVAGQFEALFVQTLLKNMRDASLGDPIFGKSEQFEMYQDMLDKQMAVEMSKDRGLGLADMLVKQLGGEAGVRPTAPVESFRLGAVPVRRASAQPAANAEISTGTAESSAAVLESAVGAAESSEATVTRHAGRWTSPREFAEDIWPHAERVAARLDVAPEALLAQAALETGWGAHVMHGANGDSSLNLFGIKAGGGWSGDSVVKNTLEYKDGIAQQEQARFRAYPDIAATFDDYAEFISARPRYASVPGNGQDVRGFAQALQAAGYATDPRYAEKIDRIVNGETMRDALNVLKKSQHSPPNQMMSQAAGP